MGKSVRSRPQPLLINGEAGIFHQSWNGFQLSIVNLISKIKINNQNIYSLRSITKDADKPFEQIHIECANGEKVCRCGRVTIALCLNFDWTSGAS